MRKLLSVAALLGSTTTIVCCFLPALFVSLGAGAAFAALIGAVPELVWLSEHKGLVFGIAGVWLLVAAIVERRARQGVCPMDPRLAEACRTAKFGANRILVVAATLYGLGFLFAFVLPRLTA
jgi:hypothetical protein